MSFKSIVDSSLQTMKDPAEKVILFAAHQGYLKAIDDVLKVGIKQNEKYINVLGLVNYLREEFNKKEEE